MNSYSFAQYESDFLEVDKLRRRGQMSRAFDGLLIMLRKRLASFENGGSDAETPNKADIMVLDTLVDLAAIFGHFQAAEDLLDAMAGLSDEQGNRRLFDYSWLKRIHLAVEYGKLTEAYGFLQKMESSIGDINAIAFTPEGLAEWESERARPATSNKADRAVFFSRLYLVMGRILAALGQYGQALASLRRGLLHTGKGAPDLAARAATHLKLAIAAALLESGDLVAAQAQLKELEDELDHLTSPGLYLRRFYLTCKLHLLRGEFGGALAESTLIRNLCVRRNFKRAALQASLNLAQVLIYLNQINAARELLKDAGSVAHSLGDKETVESVTALLRLTYERSNPFVEITSPASAASAARPSTTDSESEADNLFDSAQPDNFLGLFEQRTLDFYRKLGRRKFAEASAYLSSLENVFEHSDSQLVRLRMRLMAAVLAYYQGRIASAEAELGSLRTAFRDLDLKPELWQLQRVLGWCWARLGKPQDEQLALAGDTQALLMQMTRSLPPAYQGFFLLNKWTADEDFIAAQIENLRYLKARLKGSFWFVKPWRAWKLMGLINGLIAHIDSYRDALAKSTLEGHEPVIQDVAGPSLWRRLLRHPRKRATISFLVLPDYVLVITAGWLFLTFDICHIARVEVRRIVQSWHVLVNGSNSRSGTEPANAEVVREEAIKDDDSDSSGGQRNLVFWPTGEPIAAGDERGVDINAAGREIAASLSEGLNIHSLLSALPKRIKSLTIIPDDSLHGFPFAIIPYREKYLVESYAISFTFNHGGESASSTSNGLDRALLVGVSRGASNQFRPLPGVSEEIRKVGRWLSNRRIQVSELVNDTASKSSVIQSLSDASFVHIACHGFFEHDSPDHSGLVLIPEPERVEVLTLRELSTLKLLGLQHVSLSSCSSADNFVLPGRWVISLPETLWRAGAQSILGCSWEVNDKFAVAFMEIFYRFLERYGRDDALRLAQLECLRRESPAFQGVDPTDPINWASFKLYGRHEHLRLSNGKG